MMKGKQWLLLGSVLIFSVMVAAATLNGGIKPAPRATSPGVNTPMVTQLPGLGIHSPDKMQPNGAYVVSVFKHGQWRTVGRLACDRFFREQALDLTRHLPSDGPVRIRLVQEGGGHAHVDSVLLGGQAPSAVAGSPADMAGQKLARRDNDVLDATRGAFVLTFPAAGRDRTLRLTARVDSAVINKTPFQFPSANLFQPMHAGSQFYTYDLGSGPSDRPFFQEYCRTGSGHPSGFTYGWVSHDTKDLHVKIDFTPDNTMDGQADYAKVYALTDTGLKEFKVSLGETTWGKAAFIATEKAGYQHKVYDFTIPLAKLGTRTKALKLAFAAYGTAWPGNYEPASAWDSLNNRYLLAYMKTAGATQEIYGQLLNPDGSPHGTAFLLASAAQSRGKPVMAYDAHNQRFLVVWQDYRSGTNYQIYAQFVNADGTLRGANFRVSSVPTAQYNPGLAYDGFNHRFLIAWTDGRNVGSSDVYGQLVNADGSPQGAEILICGEGHDQQTPALAYDNINRRFLSVWADLRNGPNADDIYARLVNADGSLPGPEFVLCNALNGQLAPSVAFDGTNQRYLVGWYDYRNGNNYDIYGQLVTAGGVPSGPNFAICNEAHNQYQPLLAYDSLNHRFLAVWRDGRNTAQDLYGQQVNADGSLAGTDFPIAGTGTYTSVAYNGTCSNFLVTYDTNNFYNTYDIGASIVGAPCSADAAGQHRPAMAYDARHDRYLTAYMRGVAGKYDIYARLVDRSGAATGGEIAVCTNALNQTDPAVVRDTVNHRFLVLWRDARNGVQNADIYGRIFNADGSPYGNEFVVCNEAHEQTAPAAAFDAGNQRFLVTWDDRRATSRIYGQIVNADGTLTGWTAADVNFIIDGTDQSYCPAVSFDPTNQRYLVVWINRVQSAIQGRLVNTNGGLPGAVLTISAFTPATSMTNNPDLAYDSTNQRFLVVWQDDRSGGTGPNIYGQIVNADGTLTGWTAATVNFVVSDASNTQAQPSVVFNAAQGQYLVVWEDARSERHYDIFGQIVGVDGTLAGTAHNVNFAITQSAGNQLAPALAFNTTRSNYLAAFADYAAAPHAIVWVCGGADGTTSALPTSHDDSGWCFIATASLLS